LPDHLGSVRQLVGADGQVSLAQSYDPFGVPFEASGSGESDFGYTGEWYGSYNDLLYLRARYYDPAVGRLLNKDPFRGFVTRPQSLNGYSYVENRPLTWIDPGGYIPLPGAGSDGATLVTDPLSDEILAAIREGWDLLPNLHPDGFYGTGMISFGSRFLDIWVEPQVFTPDPINPNFGSYANTSIDMLYETVMWIQGMTNLEGWSANTTARLAMANNPNPPGSTFEPIGLPAKVADYQGLHIRLDGYAWYDGISSSPDPINASTVATLVYGQLVNVEDSTPKYPAAPFSNYKYVTGFDPYSPEGLVGNKEAMFAVGTINLAGLVGSMLQIGDIGLRKYQVIIQKQRLSSCSLPGFDKLFTDRRAIIQTYQLYRNAAGYQIHPAYLSVLPAGKLYELHEAPIYYPGIWGTTISPLPGNCSNSSTCYNRTEVVEAPDAWRR
jgi:RHS repeat-associated protein